MRESKSRGRGSREEVRVGQKVEDERRVAEE